VITDPAADVLLSLDELAIVAYGEATWHGKMLRAAPGRTYSAEFPVPPDTVRMAAPSAGNTPATYSPPHWSYR
jgi:hypothetical protein